MKYAVDIKELALLKPMTGADIRGSFRLYGNVKGTKNKLTVNGKSDLAESNTKFEAILKEFSPTSIKVNMKDLKLSKLLYMVKQPHYTDGLFSLDADISDARTGKLNGKVHTSIKNGLLNSKYITKTYKFKTQMPRTTFKMNTSTSLKGSIADSKIDFYSTLANIKIKKARMNLEDSAIVSDYFIKIPNLDKLFFVTQRHLKGAVSANGELKKAKDLDLSIYSNIAGGKVVAQLHNDYFHANLESLQTLDILDMLIYPKLFKSTLNAKLDYNLANEKGKFNGQLIDGKFTQNQVFVLVKKYAKVDLLVETFQGDVSANINKENILASLDLRSNTSSISTKNTKLNSKTKKIDSHIKIVANKSPVNVTLKGDVQSPKVVVDAEELIKSKAEEVIKKELDKLFKKLF